MYTVLTAAIVQYWLYIQANEPPDIVVTRSNYMHTYNQGHIKLPSAARGHATSNSARIGGIVLSVAKNKASG